MSRRHSSTIRPRSFVLWLLLAAVPIPLLSIGTLVFVTDPYQQFRSSDWVTGDERYVLPGLARHQSYDTVVAGNSMTQNFTRTPTASTLGGQVINLSIRGGTLFEVGNMLRVALDTRKVRRVLWGIGADTARMERDTRLPDYPHYLYDTNRLNDFRYLYNFTVVQISAAKLLVPGRKRRSLEKMFAWYLHPKYRPGHHRVLSVFAGRTMPAITPAATEPDSGTLASAETRIDRHVLALIRAHPETHFDIIVPPYSTLHYAWEVRSNPTSAATSTAVLNYLCEKLVREPNVTLHFFGSFAGVTDDLDNYKDLTHYSVAVSHRILHEIHQGTYRLTPDNYRTRLDQWQAHVRAYDIDRDLKDISGP